jgi:hypothetical protein
MTPLEQSTTVFWLMTVANRYGSHLLYDAESFDDVIGRGRFAILDSECLGHARSIVKRKANNVKHLRYLTQPITKASDDDAKGKRLSIEPIELRLRIHISCSVS